MVFVISSAFIWRTGILCTRLIGSFQEQQVNVVDIFVQANEFDFVKFMKVLKKELSILFVWGTNIYIHFLFWNIFILNAGQSVIVHSIPNSEPPAPTWLTVAEETEVVFKLQTYSYVDIVLGTYVFNDRVNTYTIHLSNFNSTIKEDTTQVSCA